MAGSGRDERAWVRRPLRPLNAYCCQEAVGERAAASELLADYELVSDLAITYGRIEELRWRLRYRSELRTKELDAMTAPLVDELRAEVAGLMNRVGAQIEQPTVQPLGLLHQRTATLGGSISATGSLQTQVIRDGDSEADS